MDAKLKEVAARVMEYLQRRNELINPHQTVVARISGDAKPDAELRVEDLRALVDAVEGLDGEPEDQAQEAYEFRHLTLCARGQGFDGIAQALNEIPKMRAALRDLADNADTLADDACKSYADESIARARKLIALPFGQVEVITDRSSYIQTVGGDKAETTMQPVAEQSELPTPWLERAKKEWPLDDDNPDWFLAKTDEGVAAMQAEIAEWRAIAASQQAAEPVATFEGYLDGGTPIIKWTGAALQAGAKLYAGPTAKQPPYDWLAEARKGAQEVQQELDAKMDAALCGKPGQVRTMGADVTAEGITINVVREDGGLRVVDQAELIAMQRKALDAWQNTRAQILEALAAPSLSVLTWQQGEQIADQKLVDEALRAFKDDPTADNATGLVLAIRAAKVQP